MIRRDGVLADATYQDAYDRAAEILVSARHPVPHGWKVTSPDEKDRRECERMEVKACGDVRMRDAQREIFVFGNAGNYAGAGYMGDGQAGTISARVCVEEALR